jgi:hypothetical protein
MVVKGPRLPRSHDEEPSLTFAQCICNACQHFWIERPSGNTSSCPMCSSGAFMRIVRREPLKQY